jgi:hypothetical protein
LAARSAAFVTFASIQAHVLTDGSEGTLYRVALPQNEVAEKTHL